MAASPAKQGVELDDMFKYEFWDCHHDFSTHVLNKNRKIQSRTEKFNYFATLSQGFLVHNPLADPDVVNFVSDLYDGLKRQLLNLQEGNRVVSNEVFDDNVEYQIFLDHLRVDGKSYVLDIPEEGIFVKYEPEEPKDYASPPATHSASNNTNERINRISYDMNLNSEAEALRTPTGRKRKHPLQTDVGSKAQKRSGRKPKQPDANNTGVQSNQGSRVKKEEDYDDDPPDLKRPLQEPVVNVDQWWHKYKVRARKHTEFREKLMDSLKKPYCEKEYERLLEQLSQRKPVQNYRDLRGRIKIYEEARPGKSFLDYHTDLAKRIDSVRDDHPRVLNLLRGFFYWLKNLSHEGAFLPWKDPSCLKVLPQ